MLPLALVTKYQMILDMNHKGLSATDVNGGELDIKGVVKMIILIMEGSRKQVSFIVCDLPLGKKPLLNVETCIALGVLPGQFLEWDYTLGKWYEDADSSTFFGTRSPSTLGQTGVRRTLSSTSSGSIS